MKHTLFFDGPLHGQLRDVPDELGRTVLMEEPVYDLNLTYSAESLLPRLHTYTLRLIWLNVLGQRVCGWLAMPYRPHPGENFLPAVLNRIPYSTVADWLELNGTDTATDTEDN